MMNGFTIDFHLLIKRHLHFHNIILSVTGQIGFADLVLPFYLCLREKVCPSHNAPGSDWTVHQYGAAGQTAQAV